MPKTSTVIGVDLAWSPKNQTGLAAATVHESCVHVEVTALACSLDDIVAFIANHVSRDVTIAIDAPTVVPHQDRMRDCERQLHQDAAIRHAQAAPYPGTRRLLGQCNGGQPRGEELVARLKAELHVNEVGCPPPLHSGRYAMEVFPAAAMVPLFSLTAPLHYKKKRNRTWAQCRHGLESYLEHLRALDKPRLEFPSDLRVGVEAGKAFKELEDRVDAVLCAYVAALAWLGQAQEIGCLESGYIVLPGCAQIGCDHTHIGFSEENSVVAGRTSLVISARLAGCVDKNGCVAGLRRIAVVERLELLNSYRRNVRESGHDFELSPHGCHVPPSVLTWWSVRCSIAEMSGCVAFISISKLHLRQGARDGLHAERNSRSSSSTRDSMTFRRSLGSLSYSSRHLRAMVNPAFLERVPSDADRSVSALGTTCS